MEEFTNGAFLERSNIIVADDSCDMCRFDATCPYCGWVYDRPEDIVPSHASCGHLVAVTQWAVSASYLNAAAFLDDDGQWKFWKDSVDCRGKESSTAGFENLILGEEIYCRFYFSRRPKTIASELSAAKPTAPRLTLERIRRMREPSGCACSCRAH
jgi:hypothetical protein